uniref:Uncharacterized protein LOC111104286 n=1 Tax=Crassostrea virginica TaxID=6565 RepID=A0A8B8AS08_CRAVI|nr:uncharacterized protein LOC111104286 [Crassostrea virginica]
MMSPQTLVSCIVIGILVIFQRVSKCREATQCAGREITLNCSSPDWLIEVENELYGYNESRACDVSANTCTGVEFLDPPSIKHCNGKPSCSFNVPTDTYLSVCRENATSLKVIYQCVAESHSLDLCTDFLVDHKSTFYLSYLQDPSPEASPLKCSCEVRGQNLSVMTLEQTRAYLSPVVYILTSETVTKHITKTVIRHRLEFSDISRLRVELDFRFPGQEFRLWLKLTGTDMWIKCGSPVINSALSSLQIIPSTHLSYLPSSSLSASIQEQHSSPSVNWTELPSINFNFTITANLDSSSMSYLSLSTISSTNHSYLSLSTVAPTESLSTWSSFSTTASGSLSSVPVTSQSTRRMSQSDEVVLIAVIGTICGLFFIIFIIATILICRKRNEEVSESRENIHRPGTNVIHAYEEDNFTVNF